MRFTFGRLTSRQLVDRMIASQTLMPHLKLSPSCAVNGSLNATSKAAIISRSVNGSGYGDYKNSAGFLDGFTKQPAQWFNVSALYLATDPPGRHPSQKFISTLTRSGRETTHVLTTMLMNQELRL